MHRVRMLIHFGVIPYIVFDGDYLPSKAGTEVERAKKREESKRKGLELYNLNKPSQAHLELQKAVEVTPEMARELIDELKKIDVQYIVSPYEADAQLAYLERKSIIQGIISEDSDLLVFGAKRLLTKLDQYGDCVEINRADFTACREISLVGWSDAEFRRMAILSGCDYLASINRMGLKSAYRYIRKYKTIEKILKMLAFDGQYHIPTGYLEKFYRAELTFLHQRVFCPLINDVVMMTDPDDSVRADDLSFIGGKIEQVVAIGVAKGDLDPMTKQPIRIKSAFKMPPRSPWADPRKTAVNRSLSTKANKSIHSFLKAQRTPLAELDPNSFTPSPTQQRLLRQADGASWELSPATADPSSHRSTSPIPSSANHPVRLTSISRTPSNLGDTPSTLKPLKRQRLCADLDDEQILGKPTLARDEPSRFFTTNLPKQDSYSDRRRKNKKGKGSDITIWSDESIEDGMVELSSITEKPTLAETEELNAFSTDQDKPSDAAWTEIQPKTIVDDDSQSSTASRRTETSQASTSTEVSSTTSSAPSVAQALDTYVATELKAFATACAYQPEKENKRKQPQEVLDSKDHLRSGRTNGSSKPQLHRQGSMTPLQRLGYGALNRSKSCEEFLKGRMGRASDSQKSEIQAWKAVRTDRTEQPPAPPLTTSVPVSVPSTVRGSEDGIIPDSQDSADDALSEAEERMKTTIDLGRFAYAGPS